MDKTIFEESIEFVDEEMLGDNQTHCYDCDCEDGIAVGTLCDDEESNAPKRIRITYPKLADVLADEDMCEEILEYRGLHDLSPSDIHYGDVMMVFGEITKVLNDEESTEQYTQEQLAEILREMASYVESCQDYSYFREIVVTGLFHDACGIISEDFGDSVVVVTDY